MIFSLHKHSIVYLSAKSINNLMPLVVFATVFVPQQAFRSYSKEKKK